MKNFKELLAAKTAARKESKSNSKQKALPSPKVEARMTAKLNNLANKQASRELEDFPSADFVNEMVKDGNSVYCNEGRIISGNLEVAEELIVLNATKIPSNCSSGKNLDVAMNIELATATVAAGSCIDAPAYRFTVTKNKELTGGRLGFKLVGETPDDKTAISCTAQVEFEKDSEVVEVVMIPTITDTNGIVTPVVFHANTAAGSGTGHYIQITGIVAGMKATIDVVSKLDVLALN